MSLDFDISEVDKPDDFYVPHPAFPDDFPDKKIYNFKYEVIIMPGTPLVGIGVLDDNTIPEFYARLNCYERLHGTLCRNGQEELFTEFETVLAMKGLKTNVHPMETRAKWLKRIVNKGFLDEVSHHCSREITLHRIARGLATNRAIR